MLCMYVLCVLCCVLCVCMFVYFFFSSKVVLLSLYSGLGQPTVQRVALQNQYSLYDTVCVTQNSDIWNILLVVYAAVLLVYGVS